MVVPPLGIGPDPLSLDRIAAALGDGAGTDGALVTFLGLVRNHNLGRSVLYLEYEAYEPLRSRRSSGSRQRLVNDGRARGWRCTTASDGWASAKRASRSRRDRPIGATRTRRAAMRSNA